MSEVYYFGSEKVAPLTVQVDFNDGILKKVVSGNEPVEERDMSLTKDKSQLKDDPKKLINGIDEAGRKLHQDLNNAPLKLSEEASTNVVPEKNEINFTSVKCGMRYAILQDDHGKLYSCGYGNVGELGLGKDKTYTKIPALIDSLEYKRIVKYSCGPTHAVAFSTDNKVYSWGDGHYGKQASSGSAAVFCPQIVPFAKPSTKPETRMGTQEDESPSKEHNKKNPSQSDYKWIDVACGSDFSIFISEQGGFGMGRETNGRLGVGAIFEPSCVPLPIIFSPKIKIMGIASGKSHSVAWDSEGYAYSWGDGSEGKLGHTVDQGFYMSKFEIYPKKIAALEKYRILLMSCGNSHTLALTNKGEIFTWGKPASNSKGEKPSYKLLEYFSPRKLTVQTSSEEEPVFIKIVCGPTHNAAIDREFNLYTWGDPSENCLGFPMTDDVFSPTIVERLARFKVIDVGCGDTFTFVIACNRSKNISSKALKTFQEGYLEHMRNTIQNIQEWRKKKVMSETKLGSFQGVKPNATLPTSPDAYQVSLADSGINKNSFSLTSNTGFLKGFSPSNLLSPEKFSTPKKGNKKEHSSGSKLPFILEASQKLSDIIDASSKNPRSPTLPSLAKHTNNYSEVLFSESTKPFSPQSSKFKINLPNDESKKKMEENQTYKNLDSVRSAVLPAIFNPTEENYKTNQTEPEDFETIFGKKGNIDEYENYSESNEIKIKDLMAKHSEQKIQAKNSKVAKTLFEEIDTNDDQLKFEYIQMVKSGKEQEHMLYLLQDPEPNSAYSETSLKHEKMKMKHQKETRQENLKARVLIDNVKKAKNSLVGKALPLSNDLIYQISGAYNTTKHFLEERTEARKIVPNEADQQPVVVVTNEDLAKRAAERRQKTLKVLEKKRQLEYEKKEHFIDKFKKRTDEYKEALRLEKIERQKKSECLKEFSSYFMFETMLNLIKVAADRGLEIKRELFLKSMKARLIQNTFKKFSILKRLKTLTPKQKVSLTNMVKNYLMNKKVRRLVLLHHRLKLEFKIKASLLLFKTKMSNIKIFLMWTHKKMEAYRYKLALEWDNHVMTTFKLRADNPISINESPLSLIKYKSTESGKAGDASPTKDPQSNQIEDFVRYSSRNFRKFLSLQNEGELKASIKLNPSILPTTYELNVEINFESNREDKVKSTKKHKTEDKKTKEFERVEMKLKNYNNLLLPFSYHYCKAMSISHRINHDTSSPFKDILFERSVEFEANLKFEFINRILKECLLKYDADLEIYRKELMTFKRKSNTEINLYRTMKLLNTPVNRLKALQKKEEYQLKRRAAELVSKKKVSHGLKGKELDDYQPDHLPFGTMLLKIAAVMPKAPKMPSLVISLKSQEFHIYFEKYYEAFKAKYIHMVAEEREKLFKRKL